MALPADKHRLSFPGLDGLYGYVTVDGQPLEVYGAKVEGKKAVGYIEAKEGKQFEVRWFDGRSALANNYNMRLYVDGARAGGRFCRTTSSKYDTPQTASRRIITISGRRETETLLAPFLFSTLKTTDDDDAACSNENVIKGLGSIQLKYNRAHGSRPASFAPTLASSAPIHERSKKAALSHQASYGAAVAVKARNQVVADYLDPPDSPLASVEFRYRSRAILQFEDFIPASPEHSPSPQSSPSPAPESAAFPILADTPPAPPIAGPSQPKQRPAPARVDSSAIELDDDELQAEIESLERQERLAQLKREQRRRSGVGSPGGASGSSSLQAQAGKKHVKAESGADDGEALKKVKREEVEKIEEQKKEDKRKGKKATVIDLCDSDSD